MNHFSSTLADARSSELNPEQPSISKKVLNWKNSKLSQEQTFCKWRHTAATGLALTTSILKRENIDGVCHYDKWLQNCSAVLRQRRVGDLFLTFAVCCQLCVTHSQRLEKLLTIYVELSFILLFLMSSPAGNLCKIILKLLSQSSPKHILMLL